MKAAKLPVKELVEEEKHQKQEEKEREKQRKAEQKRLLAQAARNTSARGKGRAQFEQEQDATFANLNVASDDPSAEGPSMDDILETSTNFNPRELGEVADKVSVFSCVFQRHQSSTHQHYCPRFTLLTLSQYGQTEEQLSTLPLAKQPALIATKMLPYQRQGLAWLIDHENPVLPQLRSGETVQLWNADRNGAYRNIATNYSSANPSLMSGGLLADDMGLGVSTYFILTLNA